MNEIHDEIEPALELPVTAISRDSPSLLDSDEDMSDDDETGSTDDDAMEEITIYDEPLPKNPPTLSLDEPLQQPPIVVPSSPNAASLPSPAEIAAQGAALSQRVNSFNSDSDTSTVGPRSHSSRRSSRRVATMEQSTDSPMPVGEKLKRRFLDMNILSTLLVRVSSYLWLTGGSYQRKDLFFEFPWNNFLHSAVYDLVHQILTGRVDGGLNRELTIALFRDARLMHRIVDGQKQNDAEWCVL